MTRLDNILDTVSTYDAKSDTELIRRAYEYAAEAHEGQTRRSGDPYVTHPLSVAGIVADLRLDGATICAALLHDAVEDTSATIEDITSMFGKEVAFLVDGVTKLGKLPYTSREERQAENFRKMLLAMARDIRVILLKFCDRLDNMRTLDHLPSEKQERIASETLQIYAPLAHRIGIQWIKTELEDLSFKYLYREEYDDLAGDVAKTRKERNRYIVDVERLIYKEMAKNSVRCKVTGRAKHLWSIRQKMQRTKRPYNEIHDAIGFRVVTENQRGCYEALGVVHAAWTPIPGRFKDYIALPKPNGYQSLHTAVIGPKGERIEIQIRTDEMHAVAEYGIAAHWKYKEGKPAVLNGSDAKFAWLRQLMESQKDLKDPTEFIESVKIDLFGEDEVFVFTPQGDVKALPMGSCPIDFAYTVHSKVGDHCSGARVNGMIVPLRYQLRNGDTVEIITSPNQKPNRDWLKLVRTARAKTRIRHKLRTEERDRAFRLGKDLLEKALRKYGIAYAKAMKNGTLEEAASGLRMSSVEELICQMGYGKVTSAQVIERVVPDDKRDNKSNDGEEASKGSLRQLLNRVARRRSTSGIKVQGEDDVLVRFARCCSPLPGDSVIGFISRGRGVTVHRRTCTKALDLDPERRVDVEWDGKGQNADHAVAIRVMCTNQPGLLAHLSQSFSDSGVNITQAHCRAGEDGRAVNTFHANVRDLSQLKQVMRSLSRIKGVFSVDRVSGDATV
ncbi:RelA/SpoT family protein [Haliangium ochraceum]|uniref:(P)ppGpp synthetase I, SpoT/RelA n=1 Tax=Haliangium ochraceum (strain DSM 14365 / JCM 11303 / SMP-2) TaxID=502025 RepID=D0LIG1_HALO1|nr:bifunctional (p)ppGpp synthetase/guanosine-3',5'-bis(diphosphate) 3'-pyrophosphohydrolase [Haliangium ochraceum]ACY18317.1 (p)ppGpp synthetase I, SpoT/RelA [Haliangium ochraceum DSM 14365]